MIDIKCKCICCGKEWTISIDEHDYERYRPGKQFSPPSSQACNCQDMPVGEYNPPVINTVCGICSEEI